MGVSLNSYRVSSWGDEKILERENSQKPPKFDEKHSSAHSPNAANSKKKWTHKDWLDTSSSNCQNPKTKRGLKSSKWKVIPHTQGIHPIKTKSWFVIKNTGGQKAVL